MNKNIIKLVRSIEEDFLIFDIENFEKEFIEIIKNIKLEGYNDISDISEKYASIINKYSTGISKKLKEGKVNEL